MKKIICISLVLMLSMILNSEKIITLNEVGKPGLMEILDGNLYIMEGSKIFLYDLKEKKFIKSFCKKGEGPGELKVNPGVSNFLSTTSNSIIAVSMDKMIEFSKDGKMLKEMKIPAFTNFIYPVKNGFIGMKFKIGKKPVISVNILDEKFEKKKELYSQQLSGGNNLIDLTADGVNITVENNKLYVEESAKGFEISIFDMNGVLIKKIKKDVPKIKFNDEHKKDAIDSLKSNPQIKQMGWDNFKNAVKIINGKFLPPIQDMMVNNNKIYIKTNNKKNEKVEFLVIDNSGKEIKKLYLPKPMDNGFISKMFGRPTRFFKFYNDTYYYIVENEEEEEWEIHSIKI